MSDLKKVKLTWEQIEAVEAASDQFSRFFKLAGGDFETGINLLFGEMRDQGIGDYFLMLKWKGDFYRCKMCGKVITVDKIIVEAKDEKK